MKYFITSDLHSFYTPLKKSLDNVGYDKNNSDHILVILGDLFDRGQETRALYEFLKSIPVERLVLVKGNHELLLEQLLEKSLPDSHDYSNGTVSTCCQMAFKFLSVANRNMWELEDLTHVDYWKATLLALNLDDSDIYKTKSFAVTRWKNIVRKVKKSDIYKWYKSLNWVNYWEIDNFIGVHSFVPVKLKSNYNLSKSDYFNAIYNGETNYFEQDTSWRSADRYSWELATWGCPYKFFDANLFPEELNKTLICGHYMSLGFHRHYDTAVSNYHDIYYSDCLIALDSTVAASKQTNVLVIDENNNCFDQYNNKLDF